MAFVMGLCVTLQDFRHLEGYSMVFKSFGYKSRENL